MTREEAIALLNCAATELVGTLGEGGDVSVVNQSLRYIEALDMAIAALREQPRWISVEERLPEVGRSVIAYNAPAKSAAEAVYTGEGRFLQFRWAARLQEQEVTHWMPLPEPPKEVER